MLARDVLILGVGLALALGVARTSVCVADEALDAARARYERGEKSFEAGKFLEAAADFEAAYLLTPRNDLLFDAARSYDKGGNAARAVELYQAYLRTGESLPEAEQVKGRLEDLNRQVAYVTVRANKDGAHILVDGRERSTTPMLTAIPVGVGTHQVEVALGNMVWHNEQEFASGLTYTLTAELSLPAPPPEEEKPNKRFAAVFGLGGVIDVTSSNFPPTQASLVFGADYRLVEYKSVSVDVSLRIPVEVAQGWSNSGILAGIRVVLDLSQRVHIELVPSLDLGLSSLHFNRKSAPLPLTPVAPCADTASFDDGCTLLGLRIHPALSLVYHFLPDWELRGEVFGLDADITSPIVKPRVTFGLSAAWRFY